VINVEAENVRLWVNEHEREDGGKWRTYSISTSSKDQETGEYINLALEVRMTRAVEIPADLKNGESVTIRGSLSNRKYKDKDGVEHKKHMLWAQEIDFHRPYESKGEPADSFEQLEEDCPF
jgi:single-stranded DNA-binding protein